MEILALCRNFFARSSSPKPSFVQELMKKNTNPKNQAAAQFYRSRFCRAADLQRWQSNRFF